MSGPKGGGKPPWMDSGRLRSMARREGDIFIAVPAKSGTNWMMNIVHQLLRGGSADFASIYDVVPWPEFVTAPGEREEQALARLDAMPATERRAFKAHAAPPELPFVKQGQGPDTKYVVVLRNPEEALVSFKIFLDMHTDAFYSMWQVPRAALTRPGFEAFHDEVFAPRGMHGMFFGFAAAWWPLRHEPNVLLMHFNDMKRDLPGSIRKVARFLDVTPTPAQWSRIDEYASFDWMKRHESKFETMSDTPVQVLERGGMVRKGKAGAAHEDGMTPRIAAELRAVGSQLLPDPAALRWLYEGGAVP